MYLLAEIRYEMFQQRMLQERILATLAVQQLQSIAPQQIQLQQAENFVCTNPLFVNSNACPPIPPTPASTIVNTETPSPVKR